MTPPPRPDCGDEWRYLFAETFAMVSALVVLVLTRAALPALMTLMGVWLAWLAGRR